MQILKGLYIIWAVFIGVVIAIFVFLYKDYTGEEFPIGEYLRAILFLYFYPLQPYLSYLIYEKTKETKNIFAVVCYYVLFFACITYCFPLPHPHISGVFKEFFILVTIYAITCIIIILWKFKINLRVSIYILLHVFIYFYILLKPFVVGYEIEWKQILSNEDVRAYIYQGIVSSFTKAPHEVICFKDNKRISCEELRNEITD